MIHALQSDQIERAREILVGALKDSLGVHWVLRNKSEEGKVMALEVLFFEGADKEGVYLSDDGMEAECGTRLPVPGACVECLVCVSEKT